jgi:GNAT superfamily N-acetyltransferase
MVSIRLATPQDVPALKELIPVSARALSRGFYTDAETESAIRHVFGPDSRLIADGTYFVAEEDGVLAGCGGWSRRRTLYGGDQTKSGEEPLLDPAREPAKVRAFFVHPDFARRGVGSRILEACLAAARAAGFRRVELAATLPGVPFYAARGFVERERLSAPTADGRGLPIVRMEREIDRD